LPRKALVNMTQTDVLSTDVLSPRTFCPHGRFVRRTFCPTDVLSPRTFCPTDVLSLRMFCRYGRFVPTDVLSLRTFCPRTFCPRTFCHWTFCLRTFCLGTIYVCIYSCAISNWYFPLQIKNKPHNGIANRVFILELGLVTNVSH
jgi:hypothetical protein